MKIEEIKSKKYSLYQELKTSDLNQKLDNGVTIFDYMIENGYQFGDTLSEFIFNNPDLLKNFVEKSKFFGSNDLISGLSFQSLSEQYLFNTYYGNMTLIEYLCTGNINLASCLKIIEHHLEIVDLLFKYHKPFTWLSNSILEKLFHNDGTYLDKFIQEDYSTFFYKKTITIQ